MKSNKKISQIIKILLISLFGLISIFLLLLLKSKSIPNPTIDPLLYIYALFVLLFYIFRMIGALLYKGSFDRVINGHERNINGFEPSVTFVVPCLNEEHVIANTIAKCYQADYPKDKMEVIVINDGSLADSWQTSESAGGTPRQANSGCVSEPIAGQEYQGRLCWLSNHKWQC